MSTQTTTTQAASGGVTLNDLHAANKARQTEWCTGGDPEPDLAFRGNELAGETGEACNVIKKLERERHGWRGSRATLDDLAQELADVIICADLCAITAGIDLAAAVVAKFNATSEKQGLATKLATAPQPAGAERVRAVLAEWFSDSEGMCRAYEGDLPDKAEIYVVAAKRSRLYLGTYGELRRAALGSGEGTAGATPAGSGSRPSDQAASHPAPAGVGPSRSYGIPNEAPDDAMKIVSLIEDAMLLAYAPNGDAHFTWRGGQDIGLIIDRAMDDAFTKGFYAGIGRKAPAPCDGSGEAGETHSGSTEGDSAVPEGQAPHPQSPSLSEVEEAKAVPCHWGGGNDIIWCSHCGAEYAYAKGEVRPACPLTASQEQDGEVRS